MIIRPRADDESKARAADEVVDAILPGKASKLQL